MKNARIFLPLLFIVLLSGLYLHFSLRTNTFFSLDDFTLLAVFRDSNVITPLSYLVSGDPWGFHKNLGYLIFFLIFKIFGTNPLPFQFSLFFFHTLNLTVLYLISLKLSKRPFSSLLATIVLNTQYLYYFSNLHEYLTTFFSLSAILVYLLIPKKKLLILASAALAVLSKEVGSLSFLVLGLIAIIKKNHRDARLFAFFFVVAILLLWLPQVITRQSPQYYQITLSLSMLYRNFLSYYPYLLGLVVLGASLVKKDWTSLGFLALSILSLTPALFLSYRHESYYLYLPYAYLGISIVSSLPKSPAYQIMYSLIILYFLGGRQAFPPIAKQEYPNWQKYSINEVVTKIVPSLDKGTVGLDGVNIERDALIMLDSGTTDLFLPFEHQGKYLIEYEKNSEQVKITKRSAK